MAANLCSCRYCLRLLPFPEFTDGWVVSLPLICWRQNVWHGKLAQDERYRSDVGGPCAFASRRDRRCFLRQIVRPTVTRVQAHLVQLRRYGGICVDLSPLSQLQCRKAVPVFRILGVADD